MISSSVRDGVVRLQGMGLEDVAPCADGSSVGFAHGFDLQPRGLSMVDGAFELEHVAFSDAFTASGSLGTRVGTGTVTHLFAALDASERPHLCSTGELTWTVQRVGTGTSSI